MNVQALPSARLLSANKNMAEFVRCARQDIGAFGRDIDFDAPVWNVSSTSKRRVSSSHQASTIIFLAHQVGTGKGMDGRTPLSEPFGAFIKALIRTRQDARAVTSIYNNVTVRAARYLYELLANRGYDPCQLVPDDFMAAANACRKREAHSSAYRIGLQLAEIAGWMNRYQLARVYIDFKNPIARPGHGDTRIGKVADERRADKLPSSAALDALAIIANAATEPSDVLRIRVIELLACGGWRINELLTLTVLCEVEEAATMNGEPVVGTDGKPVIRYGISYQAEKGGGHQTKWIPTPMVDVAKRAIRDITRLTKPSRELLSWMLANPGRALLPSPWCDQPLTAVFSMREVGDMFKFVALAAGAKLFLKGLEIPFRLDGSSYLVNREDLEAGLLRAQSAVLAENGERPGHEHLFVMPRNWCHRVRGTIECVLEFVTDQQISDFITGRVSVETVFARFGHREDDGSPMELTSHQFRHWLNTLAQEGGMSQMEIARWSGRKDLGQNVDYDHVSGVKLAEKARKMLAQGRIHGPVAQIYDRLPIVRREDFTTSQFTTAHSTDIGMCGNDWSLAPCPVHGACAGCEQHFIVKGDVAQRARAETMLSEHEFLLAAAEKEAEEETYGASNFVEHHRQKCVSLRKILAVHDEPTIPSGDLVHLDLERPVVTKARFLKMGRRNGNS